MKRKIQFDINGRQFSFSGDPSASLLSVLRGDLHLTGTKEGCGKGHCGACSVLIDGRLALACITTVAKVEGKSVTTIEGIGSESKLHIIQKAFVEAGAVQCGFCTPGMVIAAKSLLDKNPNPSLDEIKRGMSHNLCRCTGYKRIIEGVQRAASLLRGEFTDVPTQESGGVGKPVISVDAVQKVTGTTLYSADLQMEHMLVAKLFRSPHAHAKILSIDVSEANAISGVVGIFTGHDVPGQNILGYMEPKDHPVLATEKVRQIGDPIVLVAAESEAAADTALQKIRVTYEELPRITNTSSALDKDSPLIHERGNQIKIRGERMVQPVIKGDVDRGFGEADFVIENTYQTPFQEHAYLEPEAGIAYLDDQQRIVVESGNQDSHHHQNEISLFLGLPPEKIHVIQAPLGGSFGSKIDVSVQLYLALVVHRLRRPVKMVWSREESFLVSPKRHASRMRLKHGVRNDGRITALEGEIVLDTGAYASWGPNVLIRALIHGTGPYEIDNVHLKGKLVYTNNTLAGAFRGFGLPQIMFGIESQMDLLAAQVGMDPLEFRAINALKLGSTTGTGQKLSTSVGLLDTLSAVRRFRSGNNLEENGQRADIRRGQGIACMHYGIGYTAVRNPSPVELEFSKEGIVHIYSGAVDMGQGPATIFRQMVVEDLGVPFERTRVTLADTDLCQNSLTTCASRTTYYSGNAIRMAVSRMKKIILDTLSRLSNHECSSFILDGDHIRSGDFHIPLSRFHEFCSDNGIPLRTEGLCDPDVTGLDEKGAGSPYATYAYATQMADVEVNLKTGEVKVLRVVSAHDVGKAINPLLIEEQIEGAVMQGLGYALMEDYRQEKTVDFKNYRIPRFSDTPEIVSIVLENEDPTGPFGAKGVSECALIPTAVSISNAIANAIGARIYKIPVKPNQIKEIVESWKKG